MVGVWIEIKSRLMMEFAVGPFIQIGSVVKEGDTLCIIEAMKILNEIESDKSGTVTQILCENGQAVEYGQALFIVE